MKIGERQSVPSDLDDCSTCYESEQKILVGVEIRNVLFCLIDWEGSNDVVRVCPIGLQLESVGDITALSFLTSGRLRNIAHLSNRNPIIPLQLVVDRYCLVSDSYVCIWQPIRSIKKSSFRTLSLQFASSQRSLSCLSCCLCISSRPFTVPVPGVGVIRKETTSFPSRYAT